MEGSDARERAGSDAHATEQGATSGRLGALSRGARVALLDDERLALLASRGSKRGFARLRERYQQPLYAYCYLLLRDADGAYEALQATLARALAEMRDGARDELLRPWLFRIAHEQAHMLARERACDGPERSATEQISALEDAPEERARLAQLAGDLNELPIVQRSALLMRELTGMRHAEIANALGISRAAVRQSIFLARRSLSEFQLGRSLACEEVCRTLSQGDGRRLRRRTMRAHLRDCSACAAFAGAIEERRTELRALTPALAAGVLARVASGSKPGTGMLAGCSATKTAAATLAAKAAAVAASAVALTAGMGAGVAFALVQAEGRPPGTPSPVQQPRKVGALRIGVPAARRGAHARAPHSTGDGETVGPSGALDSSPRASSSLAPPMPGGGAASSAADASSAPGHGAAAADAAPGWPILDSAADGRSAGSERRGRGNGARERGRARARGQTTHGGSGKPPQAQDAAAGSGRAREQGVSSPGSTEAATPSPAEGHRPSTPKAESPEASNGQKRAAPNEEGKQESPLQPETPQLGEAAGTPPLPALPAAAAV